jgi:ABC-type sugar transport system substrate-binding protein
VTLRRTTFIKAAAAAVIALVAGGSLAACSGGSTPSGSGGADAKTIGFVNFDTTSITANSFATASQAAVEGAGWTFLVQDPKGDPAQANTICNQYVTRQVSAVVVNTFESSQMGQCMAAAKGANIPVFFIGSLYTDGMAGAISSVVPGPINDAFAKAVKDQGVQQSLELTYNPGAPCRVREEELDALNLSVTATKQEVTIPGQTTSAQAATQAWLNAHPADKGEKLAIWACFSDPAFGALAAIKQAGRTGENIPIYTWDLTKQIVDAIKADEITATLWIDANGMGQQLVQMINDYDASGKPVGQVEGAYEVVTADNIDAFLAANPDAAQ